ncbi:hypothetical protein ACJRO7_034217 [Eucalyptus globulus]|uniref:Uncharacterized protein n=1 Tax=Eucalyptus globulus TaxID=34317 RepID=A0ABD3J8E3_EUCGL
MWKHTSGGVSIASYLQAWLSGRGAGARRGHVPRQVRTRCSSLELQCRISLDDASPQGHQEGAKSAKDRRRCQEKASEFVGRSLELAAGGRCECWWSAEAGHGSGSARDS